MKFSKLLFYLALLVVCFAGSSKKGSKGAAPRMKGSENATPPQNVSEKATSSQKNSEEAALFQKVNEEDASSQKNSEEAELFQKVSEEDTSSKKDIEKDASFKEDYGDRFMWRDCTKVKDTLRYVHQVINGEEADEICSFEEGLETLKAMTGSEFLQCVKSDEQLFWIEGVNLEEEDADLMKETLLIRYRLMWNNASFFKDEDFFQDPYWFKKIAPSTDEISRLTSNWTKLSQKHPKLSENAMKETKKINPKIIEYVSNRVAQAINNLPVDDDKFMEEFAEAMEDFMKKQKAMNEAGLAMGNLTV